MPSHNGCCKGFTRPKKRIEGIRRRANAPTIVPATPPEPPKREVPPKIAAAMCPGLPIPFEWPEDRFDLVWVFDRHSRKPAFKQVPQLLLAGDEAEGAPLNKP